MGLKITVFPCLTDNYGYLLQDEATGRTASLDAPDAAVISHHLAAQGLHHLDFLFNTHWHPDHAGGNATLKLQYGCTIYGPPEVTKMGPIDHVAVPGSHVMLGQTRLDVLDLGGHTEGLIGWHDAEGHNVFVGDCLFTLGCGRLFEGTAEQMWASELRLCALPDDTRVWHAHEYTLVNLAFAESLGIDAALAGRGPKLRALRDCGEATVPTTIGAEKATNPFLVYPLREPTFEAQAAKFAELRAAKDAFKP